MKYDQELPGGILVSVWFTSLDTSTSDLEKIGHLVLESLRTHGLVKLANTTRSQDIQSGFKVSMTLKFYPDFDSGKSHQMQSTTSTLSGNGEK